jgi:regulator of replication initiation timing
MSKNKEILERIEELEEKSEEIGEKVSEYYSEIGMLESEQEGIWEEIEKLKDLLTEEEEEENADD